MTTPAVLWTFALLAWFDMVHCIWAGHSDWPFPALVSVALLCKIRDPH